MIFTKLLAASSLCLAVAFTSSTAFAETPSSPVHHGKKKPAAAHKAGKKAHPAAMSATTAKADAPKPKSVKPAAVKTSKAAGKSAGKTGKHKHPAPAKHADTSAKA
jgi:hypothetical protein